MRTYTHGGLGRPTEIQHNILDSENVHDFFLVLLTGFEPWSQIYQNLESDAVQIETPHLPGTSSPVLSAMLRPSVLLNLT